ncbi:flavin reductase, partial [Nocardioides sp. SOB72]|nr:flavin reductase [Nocardioides abyssi]
MLALINGSSAPFEPEVDEAAAVGVKMEPSERVSPARVADSPASLECTLHSTIELGDSTVVFGNVVTITVRTEVLEDS